MTGSRKRVVGSSGGPGGSPASDSAQSESSHKRPSGHGKRKGNKAKTEIVLDRKFEGKWKAVTGSDDASWALRLVNVVACALPDRGEVEALREAVNATCSGMLDMKPTDPVEGMLISQMIIAHEAAMRLYRLGWLNFPEHFEASTKYLALADKAARTVVMLTERLDQHRGRGQQQITVKYVTVNADQAVVADQIVSGSGKEAAATGLLTARTDKAMEMIEPSSTSAIPVAGGGSEKK
jgi:hypothetical protein